MRWNGKTLLPTKAIREGRDRENGFAGARNVSPAGHSNSIEVER